MYVGPFESEENCSAWKDEYDLPFPVIPDEDGTLFKSYTNGWVPWSVLVGPDQRVIVSENEFDEAGFGAAIQIAYEEPAEAKGSTRRPRTAVGRVVILGGGTGGIVAAHELRKTLPDDRSVVLLDQSPDHVFQPSLLWQIVGERSQDQLRRPLGRLSKKGVDFRNERVEEIDVDAGVVRTVSGELEYDQLVVSLGARLAPESIDGFDEMAHNLYDPHGCDDIHVALERFEGGTIGIAVTSIPFKCPAAPYEAAFLIESFLRGKGIRRKAEIRLFTPEHAPMPVAPAVLGESVEEMLAARGIHYHPLYTFSGLRPEASEIVAADGRADHVDLLIAVPPHQAPDVVRSSPLLGTSGFVHVDPKTLRTEHDDVYAIGDVTTIKLPNGKALPKAGVFAHGEAKVAAEQIVGELRGESSDASFDGKGYCWIELGDGRAAFAGGRFYAEPEPQLKLRRPGRALHWGKVAFEKWWLRRWF